MQLGIELAAIQLPSDKPPASGPPPAPTFILMENSGYVLQETGDKIQLE